MSRDVTPEMIALLNGGNKRELRAFLKLYARPVYDRALAVTGSPSDAKHITSRVISHVVLLAAKGQLEEDIDTQMMAITDACCSDDLFFTQLVDDSIRDIGDIDSSIEESGAEFADPAPAYAAGDDSTDDFAAQSPYGSTEDDSSFAKSEFDSSGAYMSFEPDDIADTENQNEYDVPDLFDEPIEPLDYDVKTKSSPFLVVLIFLFSIIVVLLVWVLLVKLMHLGAIPMFDLGFGEWFNSHIFMLY